jgi:hypothetical protein
MALPGSDEPPSIQEDEAKQELFGRGPSRVGLEAYEVGAIVLVLFGLIIALHPNRRE